MSQRLLFASKPLFRPLKGSSILNVYRQHAWRQYTKEAATSSTQEVTRTTAASVKPVVVEGKFKQLARKYGPSGVLVYLGVGFIDLGFTFATIQLVGSDKVRLLEKRFMDTYRQNKERFGFKGTESTTTEHTHQEDEDEDGKPSLTSVFLLAYGIHKTLLLPVRLAITTAITPALVRKVHAWGWAKYAPRLFGVATSTVSKP
ncbi:hypothetical protein [Absidia glauca]|uniref:DUF1279 domain-containing protein n=1 Tax=Absidia glauca TaxID=4829 RepID=A0A168M7H8_ABSGL|nr:hypothetical protein [Absidia glauca]